MYIIGNGPVGASTFTPSVLLGTFIRLKPHKTRGTDRYISRWHGTFHVGAVHAMYMQCTLHCGQVTTAIGFVEADGVRSMYFGFGRKIVSADALPRGFSENNPQSLWPVVQPLPHRTVTE